MAGFDRSPTERAVRRLRDVVREVAVEAFEARIVEAPIPGFQVLTDRRLDDPLAGVRAALLARTVAEGQMFVHARDARAAGRSWDEVGAALDLPAHEFSSRAEAAFGWLVEGREPDSEPDGLPSFRTPSAWWRCGTCDQQVTDHGPSESSHPDDSESGHATGCARHAGDVAAWQQRTGWEDGR